MEDLLRTLAQSLKIPPAAVSAALSTFHQACRAPPLRNASPHRFPPAATAICALYDASLKHQDGKELSLVGFRDAYEELVEKFHKEDDLYKKDVFQSLGAVLGDKKNVQGLSGIEKFYRGEYSMAKEYGLVDSSLPKKRKSSQAVQTCSTTTMYRLSEADVAPSPNLQSDSALPPLGSRGQSSITRTESGDEQSAPKRRKDGGLSTRPSATAAVTSGVSHASGDEAGTSDCKKRGPKQRSKSRNVNTQTANSVRTARDSLKFTETENEHTHVQCPRKGSKIIFRELHFVLVLGAGFSVKQAEILSLRIREHGGTVEIKYKDKKEVSPPENRRVVIIANKFEVIERKVDLRDDYELHAIRWVDTCIKAGRILGKSVFEVSRPSEKESVARDRRTNQEKGKGKASGTGGFACERPVEANEQIPKMNRLIIETLSSMRDHYQLMKDNDSTWRVYGYQKAISAVQTHPTEINTMEEARKIGRFIGKNILTYIEEIVRTGRCTKAEVFKADTRLKVIKLFRDIWGVGSDTANQWYDRGFRTLDDLRQAHHASPKGILSANQLVGLKYYNDFLLRIPREEVSEMEVHVKRAVSQECPTLGVTTCGSYRRLKKTCGDVDILIHGPPHKIRGVLESVVRRLHDTGFLTDDLMMEKKDAHKYMGVCQLAGKPHRRIDLMTIPEEEFPFALLYFTGNAHFNRSMRLKANKMGLHLNESGLTHMSRWKGPGGKQMVEPIGARIPAKSEEDIFRLLQIPYKPPEERDPSLHL